MNTVLSNYGQLCGCPEILKKSCKFFCRGLDIRVAKIKKADADKAVLEAVKQQVRMAVREEALPAGVKSRAVPCPWQEEMKTLEKTAAAMKKAWMPLYEQYTDGNLSREDFLLEKKRHEEELGRLESRMDELKREQEAQWEGDRKEKERASQLAGFAGQMELTEEIKEKLIDKVKVYSDNRIEICWKFEAGFPETDTMYGCG